MWTSPYPPPCGISTANRLAGVTQGRAGGRQRLLDRVALWRRQHQAARKSPMGRGLPRSPAGTWYSQSPTRVAPASGSPPGPGRASGPALPSTRQDPARSMADVRVYNHELCEVPKGLGGSAASD